MPSGVQRFARQQADLHKAGTPDLPLGEVTAVTSGVATVAYLGASHQLPHLASYTPAVNDVVVLARAGGTWIILGPLAGFPA